MGLFYKYKLGDKVCVISKGYAKAEVIARDINWQDRPLYVIEYFDQSVRDYNNRTDCNKLEIDIILDFSYYRDKSLNELLGEDEKEV